MNQDSNLKTFDPFDQHDNHCRMTADGQNWWIVRLRGHLLDMVNENGTITVDLNDVQWEAYEAEALRMMRMMHN